MKCSSMKDKNCRLDVRALSSTTLVYVMCNVMYCCSLNTALFTKIANNYVNRQNFSIIEIEAICPQKKMK